MIASALGIRLPRPQSRHKEKLEAISKRRDTSTGEKIEKGETQVREWEEMKNESAIWRRENEWDNEREQQNAKVEMFCEKMARRSEIEDRQARE